MTTATANQVQRLYTGDSRTSVLPTFVQELSIPTFTRLQSAASPCEVRSGWERIACVNGCYIQ